MSAIFFVLLFLVAFVVAYTQLRNAHDAADTVEQLAPKSTAEALRGAP